jgi:DNA invertase Pin-like site-specific DNA recombinase
MAQALAYYRTSSAANVGNDKDSETRQREAVAGYAKANKLTIVDEYYDAAVSGADMIEDRPGFSALLDQVDSGEINTVIVEGIDRLARGMEAGVLGLASLRARGVTLLDARGENLTDDVDEMTEAMISISLVFATLEKKRLVKKLSAARERKRKANKDAGILTRDGKGKCEGRKSKADTDPKLAYEAKRLRRKNPKSGKVKSYRKIAAELAGLGFTRGNGEAYNAMTISNIIG